MFILELYDGKVMENYEELVIGYLNTFITA